jgi:RsiW-degrading membrane proteinase PrsW (M82 family)
MWSSSTAAARRGDEHQVDARAPYRLLAPVGHGLWTAILGGVLFSASARDHYAITGRLILSYLGVSVLHALWDSIHNIALLLTLLLTEGESYRRTPHGWLVQPTPAQLATTPSHAG